MANIKINGEFSIDVKKGVLLSNALNFHASEQIKQRNLAPVATPCNGAGTCKKCLVKASGKLSPITPSEQQFLNEQNAKSGFRFACFCEVLGDCTVELPKASHAKIKAEGTMPAFELKPLFKNYGVAFDIGTTTLAAQLYSENGTLLSKASAKNPQQVHGADVITRIGFSLENKENAKQIATCLKEKMCEMLFDMCEGANISPLSVDYCVIVGNTAMLYLLNGLNAKSLSCAPFNADFLFNNTVSAKQLGLTIENANVYFPPCISSFVGADITASVLASEMCNTQKTSLLCDIGTNGEIALWHNEKLLCCSTAAGPAFEGAGIQMGMGGEAGAIDHVSLINGEIKAHVIGDTQPKGICGSGIIDAVYCLLKKEEIDETGFMENEIATIKAPVIITQKDVRQIQLAKSAICAGIETMLCENNLNFDDLLNFYVAGGFGSYLDIQSASEIGLVPKSAKNNANVLGNAALMGACSMLLSEEMQKKAVQIAQNATATDLSTHSLFIDKYTECMMF